MSDQKPLHSLDPARRRRRVVLVLVRVLATSVGLVALYYLAPLHKLAQVPVALLLSVELLILTAVAAWQVVSITCAKYPAIRAVEALSVTTPLFLLLLATGYFLLAQDNPANFSAQNLTRTDTLYFTVETFSTVGFGDITATSQAARLIVTAQMLLDLVVLGLGIRLFLNAIQAGQKRQSESAADLPS